MYALACCNSNGECFAFLGKDKTSLISDEERLTDKYLLTFKTKRESSELCNQINLGHLLLPNGRPYRVTPVKM